MDAQDVRELVNQAIGLSSKSHASPWLLSGEDALRIRALNSAAGVALALEGRVLRFDGQIHAFAIAHTPNTDRTETTGAGLVGDGVLLNFSVRAAAGTPRVGQCFVTVELVRGTTGFAQPLGALVAGYVTDSQRLAWPGTSSRRSVDGPGVIRSVAGTDPAAGVEVSETVPANARWRLHALLVELVTSAVAANRRVTFHIDDGAADLYRATSNQNHVASTTQGYSFAPIGVQQGAADNIISVASPLNLPLAAGFRIRTETTAIDAGDDYGAPQLLVQEWIED